MITSFLKKTRSVLLYSMLGFAIVAGAQQVDANETANFDYGTATAPVTINNYSRLGSTQNLTKSATIADLPECSSAGVACTNLVADTVVADINCTTATTNGGWVAGNVTGRCFESVDICYGVGTPAEICTTVAGANAAAAAVDLSAFTLCSSPSAKGLCLHDYDGTIGLTDATGDDMLSISVGASTYIEYDRFGAITDPDRLKWIQRNAGDGPLDMMLPSGPPVTFADYSNFMASPPSSVSVQSACYPVTADICTSPNQIQLPEIAGACGAADEAANGTYTEIAQIPAGDFCYIGEARSKNDFVSMISWECSGVNGGATTQCGIEKNADGLCGTAHTAEFSSLADVQSANLCRAGAPSGLMAITAEGPYQWNCGATGPTGTAASCVALHEGKDCDSFFENDNMVFVQDVSGSFGDDIGNITTALGVLFNDPVFAEWNVGITRFSNSGTIGGYSRVNDFIVVEDDRAALVNNTAAHANVIGGSENAFHGIVMAANDYASVVPNDEQMTIVLVTDEAPGGYHGHTHHWEAEALQAINDNNIRFVALTAGNAASNYYTGLANSIGGEQVTITSDSSNFYSALLQGLVEVNCD
jgi:hypothetical protein